MTRTSVPIREQLVRQTDDRPAGGHAAAAAAAAGAAEVEGALARLHGAVDTLAAVDPATLAEDAVTGVLQSLSAVDGRLDGVKARFVQAAEIAGVPERSGATSTTDWLSGATGRSKRESARTGRMAKAMQAAPALGERLAAGKVGPDQADRIARGLDKGTLEPDDATDLLDHAAHLPPAQFNRETKRLEGRRQQRRLREQEDAAHQARRGSIWREDDGSLGLKLLVPPADGDLVEKALHAFVQPDPAEVPDHLRRTYPQLVADAFTDMCRTVLQTGAVGEVGGVRPQFTVMVGPEMLAAPDDAAAAGATGVTDLDTVLTADALQGLLCDATFVRTVIDAEGRVLDVGRTTRKWPGAIRTAITALDGGDRTPGSDLPPYRCEIHHITWWEHGGETSVQNGILLGKRGHDMIHREGWSIRMDPTTRICTWTSPDGETTVTTYPRGTAARGEGAPHDIPELQTARRDDDLEPAAGRSRARRATRPVRPTGRGDPARPRGPGVETPGAADRAPPSRQEAQSLQLEL